jgi:hypothetical protein
VGGSPLKTSGERAFGAQDGELFRLTLLIRPDNCGIEASAKRRTDNCGDRGLGKTEEVARFLVKFSRYLTNL